MTSCSLRRSGVPEYSNTLSPRRESWLAGLDISRKSVLKSDTLKGVFLKLANDRDYKAVCWSKHTWTTPVKVTKNNLKANRVKKQKLSKDSWHKGSENNTRNTHTKEIRKKFTANKYISNSFFASKDIMAGTRWKLGLLTWTSDGNVRCL